MADLPPCMADIYWKPSFAQGAEFAKRLFVELCQNPAFPGRHGLGLPVRFWTRGVAPGSLPPTVPRVSEYSASIVLIDDGMGARDDWPDYVADLAQRLKAAGPKHRFYPVACSASALNLHPVVSAVNYIRIDKEPVEKREEVLVDAVLHELCRLLMGCPRAGDDAANSAAGPPPVKVFISHAKKDGESIAKEFRDYLNGQLQLKTFFDSNDIPPGSSFEQVLAEALKADALVAFRTDAYGERPWCQFEVLHAKRGWIPMVGAMVVEEGGTREFPYLGNIPTISCPAKNPRARFDQIIGRLLSEVLRKAYFTKRVQHLVWLHEVQAPCHALPYPPELVTVPELREIVKKTPDTLFVYPDPPLGKYEMERLQTLAEGLRFLTPTQLLTLP